MVGDDELLDETAPAIRGFDRQLFEADGVYVWPSVLTPRASAALRAACQRVQRLNDEWISTDWGALDWPALQAASTPCCPSGLYEYSLVDGMRAPGWTEADIEQGLGCTHALPKRYVAFKDLGYRRPQWDHPRVPVLKGFPPEMFAAGYDDTIMRCLTHPQMLKIHRWMLGSHVRFDHNTLLNRKAGWRGQGWHSHQYSEDDQGVTIRAPTYGQVRTLIYPDGFKKGTDAGLRVVKGGHLYRQTKLKPRSGTTAAGPNWALDDRQFKAEWLDDKAHPITGEPLQITEIELPPGSMVSCLTHAPHAVSPKKVTATGSGTTRYCTLFCYAAADPEGKQRPSDARATWSLPIEFERKAVGGQLKSVDPDVARGLFTW